jgi:putative hydrolase of the HAD superfamily
MIRDSTCGFGKRPHAVFLDLDDTLYPERQYVVSGINAVADFLASHVSCVREEIAARLLSLLDEGREQLFDRLLNELGLHSPSVIATLVHVYRTHLPTLSFCDDVLPALERLRTAGIRIGIVTDGKATMQRKKIEALVLAEQVDAIVCSDDLFEGCGKPSLLPFEVALSYLRVPPWESVYIGDDLSKDFIGPRQLGMGTIRIDRRLPYPLQPRTDFPATHRADRTYQDLGQAVSFLLMK